MKNTFKIFGFIALTALLGFTYSACNDPSNGPGGSTTEPVTETVAAPTATPGSGKVASGTQVELKTTTQGASIYYTLDGTTPDASSVLYENKITITKAVTIKAIAVKSGMNNSSILTAEYTVDAILTPIVAAHITVTEPKTRETPNTTANGEGDFNVGTVTWTPNDNPFKAGTPYKATVTLTANANYTFTGLIAANTSINGQAATIEGTPGTAITLTYTFPNTAPTYTVTYNGNGQDSGTVPVDTNSPYVSGSTVTVLGNTGNLKKTDFAFIGWITDTDPLVGADYEEGETFIITQNTVLYAHWISDAHGISLMAGETDITSKTLHFPDVTFGYTEPPAAQTITVTNIGDNPTGTMSIELSRSDNFTPSTTSLGSINPGGTVTFTIVPKTGLINGHHTTTITVKSNEVNATFVASFNVNPGVITINTHPDSPEAFSYGNISGNLNISASATGGELSYQWYINTTPFNTGGTEVADGTDVSFTIPTNLETGTYYYFCEVRATGGAAPKRSDAATVTVNRAGGAAVTVLTINETTHNSITVNAVVLSVSTGQQIEYAINTTNDVPASGWGTDRTFGGLNSNTTYYFFARSAETNNYTSGEASRVSQTTLQAMPANVITYYWINEQGQMATTSGTTVLSKNAGETLTINADGIGYTNPIWSVNGITDTTQSGTSYIFSAAGKTVGVQYTIGLRVQKDGKYYNTNFVVMITD